MSNIDTCRSCIKRKFDSTRGVICELTNEKPTFADDCEDYERDNAAITMQHPSLKPNAERGKVVVVFLWIILGLEIAALVSSAMQYDLLSSFLTGVEIADDVAEANDARESFKANLNLMAYLGYFIIFIMWFRRAYFNLHQLPATKLSYGEGMAAGAWFIPFVNLYRPFEIMKELYVQTKKRLLILDPLLQINLNTKFLPLWWTLWIISGVLGRIYYQFSKDADTVEKLLNLTIFDALNSIVGIILTLATIHIVKKYVELEVLFHRKEKELARPL